MSRYGDDYDGDNFPNEGALWQANADRALEGKRGRKALAELREALMALPAPRLIEGALCTVNPAKRMTGKWDHIEIAGHVEASGGEGVCAIGALLWHRKVKAGMDPVEAFDSLPTLLDSDSELHETAQLAVKDAGIVFSLAWNLAYRNDEQLGDRTPEERHAAFITWIDEQLAEVAAA